MDCLFCKIANGEIPVEKVYEDEEVVAFNDINPEAPVHILIVPKKHISSIAEIEAEDLSIVSKIFSAAKLLAEKNGLSENGYRIVNNCGKDGGQTVMHLHFHLLGGRSFNWPPG
jgi:histidine triad (HIT) family protein